MRLLYDITLPWIRISDWTKVAKRHTWVCADVSVVIMTSHSSWIKSSNWTKVIQESALLLWGHNPPYYYAVLVGQILVNACAPHYQSGFMQVTAPDDFKLGVESLAPLIPSFLNTRFAIELRLCSYAELEIKLAPWGRPRKYDVFPVVGAVAGVKSSASPSLAVSV